MPDHLLVAGASGVVGSIAVDHFSGLANWSVTALSRSAPVSARSVGNRHLAVDLGDAEACETAISRLAPVSHLIYAAVTEAPGLVAGWQDDGLMAANDRMLANILGPLAKTRRLRHVVLLQGAKAYGAHRHAVEVPAREDRPRDDHPNFYFLQEDRMRALAQEAGFAFTIFRPQVVLGAAPGAAMNPVGALGAYVALCNELGLPCACPGNGTAILECVDAELLAEAFAWSFASDQANNEVFNITNGDVLVPRHAWPHLAAALGIGGDGQGHASLATFFEDPATLSAWGRLAARHRLRLADLSAVLGQSHHYVDLLFGDRLAAKPMPLLLSTIKLRQAGFHGCRDSVASLLHWLRRMVDLKVLPPLGMSQASMICPEGDSAIQPSL